MLRLFFLGILFVLFLCKDALDYQEEVDLIIDSTLNKDHKAYKFLADLVDTFGPRPSGSDSYFKAAEWLKNILEETGFENVQKEKVKDVPHIIRGKEVLKMTKPYIRELGIAGIAPGSPGEVSGEIVILSSPDEAEIEKVKGKIVLFHKKWKDYEDFRNCRHHCTLQMEEFEVKGVLVSSPYDSKNRLESYQVQEGTQQFWGDDKNADKIRKVVSIPSGTIPYQDADLIKRLILKEKPVEVYLKIETTFKLVDSFNVIGEIKGSKKPEEVVIIGGHLDSWDLGDGAVDDGAGIAVTFEAMRTLIELDLKPSRTIRFIAFCDEEVGIYHSSGEKYLFDHIHHDEKHVFAFEHDLGVFDLRGYDISENIDEEIMDDILYLQKNLFYEFCDDDEKEEKDKECYIIGRSVEVGTDIEETVEKLKVPFVSPISFFSENYYEIFHHTNSDRLEALDPDELDTTVASIASMIFVIADMEGEIIG